MVQRREVPKGFVVVKGKEECPVSYRSAKTLGFINMDENHVVGSIKKPETSPKPFRHPKCFYLCSVALWDI